MSLQDLHSLVDGEGMGLDTGDVLFLGKVIPRPLADGPVQQAYLQVNAQKHHVIRQRRPREDARYDDLQDCRVHRLPITLRRGFRCGRSGEVYVCGHNLRGWRLWRRFRLHRWDHPFAHFDTAD